MPMPEPPDDFKLEPKVGFLGQPELVLAYRRAREEPWFSQALIHAVAQFTLRPHDAPRPGMLSVISPGRLRSIAMRVPAGGSTRGSAEAGSGSGTSRPQLAQCTVAAARST